MSMKGTRRIFLRILALCAFCPVLLWSQTQSDSPDYFVDIRTMWSQGKFDSAITSSGQFYSMSPSGFTMLIHDLLPQDILSTTNHRNASTYLKRLYRIPNQDIHHIVSPLHAFNAVMEAGNKDTAEALIGRMSAFISDSSDYTSRAGRYLLLALQQLEGKGFQDLSLKTEVIKRIIQNRAARPIVDSMNVVGRGAEAERAWHRFILSHCYYLLYAMNPDDKNAAENLASAAKYCPDPTDRQVSFAYFYDEAFLAGEADPVDVEWIYVDYLLHHNRKQEALTLATSRTIYDASDTNYARLRALYHEVGSALPFAQYWLESINSLSKVAPKLSLRFTDGKTVQFGEQSNKWTYVDVWGTWCDACIRELPAFELFYRENLTTVSSRLSVFSFSWKSTRLVEFLKTHDYTFPVAEIDTTVVHAFDVDGYPTKILITPQGKFLRIPFGVDWQEYVRNYIKRDQP